MTSIPVTVTTVREVREHPNADRLEIARVFGFDAIVGIGAFKAGDLVAYIPEQAVLPDALIEEMGLTGRLAGSRKNRVKTVRLRGHLSQGLVLAAREGWAEGYDASEELGIVKYEPTFKGRTNEITAGVTWWAGDQRCIRYDIENIKRWPGVFEDGEQVVMTEKIHGTFCGIGYHARALQERDAITVFSKGRGARGAAFVLSTDSPSLYERAFNKIRKAISPSLGGMLAGFDLTSVFVLCEIFGRGMQDLDYGADISSDEALGVRVFDVALINPAGKRWLNDAELATWCSMTNIERVPVLYRGPFSQAVLDEHMNGTETISGREVHMREGVVVRPVIERRHPALRRVQLKAVSEAYLLRRNATEYQ